MNYISTDEVADEDLLGRKMFAKQLVKTLHASFLNTSESCVVGLCGQWGSGKSTLLNYISDELKISYQSHSAALRIVTFNGWEISGLDSIQKSLLQKIIANLRVVANEIKENKFKANLRKFAYEFSKYATLGKDIKGIGGAFINAVDAFGKNKTLDSLDELRSKANSLIVKCNIKLFVLIDDLDRLSPDEIINVFKLIKLNANFKNTVFLVAYDKRVVTDALSIQFGKNAESYLEKIIQVEFVMPEIVEDKIENIFFEQLKKTIKDHIDSYNEQDFYAIWKYYGISEYFRTVRDIKRYFNSLLLSFPNISKEVDAVDYFILEAIKVFDFESYQRLFDDYIGISRKAITERISFDDALISTYKNQTSISLLKYLFTKTSTQADSIIEKRLRNREHFRRYYSLYIGSKDVAEYQLSSFLTNGTNRSGILKEMSEQGRMQNFLRSLADNQLKNKYQIVDLDILTDFLVFFDKYEYMNSAISEYAWHGYFNLVHSFKKDFDAAKQGVRKIVLLDKGYQPFKFYLNHFIVLFKNDNRIDPQFYGKLYEQITLHYDIIFSEFVSYMRQAWHTYFSNILHDQGLYASMLFIYSFSRHCKKDYEKALDEYWKIDKFCMFILKYFFVHINSDNGKPFRINLQYMNLILPDNYGDLFLSHLKAIKHGSISEEDDSILIYFIREYESYSNSK